MNEVALEYFTKLLAEYTDILSAGQYAAVSEVLRGIENGSDADILYGTVVIISLCLLDALYDVKAFCDFAKDGVLSI